MAIKGKRAKESPSSLNTYKQCPRKYFYVYRMGFRTPDNIYLLRGTLVHNVLEKLWDNDIKLKFTDMDKFAESLKDRLRGDLDFRWKNKKGRITTLAGGKEQEKEFHEQSLQMMDNFADYIIQRMNLMEEESVLKRYRAVKPSQVEAPLDTDNLRGKADTLDDKNEMCIEITDYKTSKKTSLTKDYKFQIGMYAMMYKVMHGKDVHRIGIHFLNKKVKKDEDPINWIEGEELAKVVAETEREMNALMALLEKTEVDDFPCKKTPLCKWDNPKTKSKGQCDFYDFCKLLWDAEDKSRPVKKVPMTKDESIARAVAFKRASDTMNTIIGSVLGNAELIKMFVENADKLGIKPEDFSFDLNKKADLEKFLKGMKELTDGYYEILTGEKTKV